MSDYLPVEALEIGECYEIAARNIARGIWDGHAFHGIRYKFGSHYIDSEIHWDLDDTFGTAKPLRKLT